MLKARPWSLALGWEILRQIFAGGRDPAEVLSEYSRPDVVDRWRANNPSGSVVPTGPRPDELTIADIDPTAPPGHAERVVTWARSVAVARGLVNRAQLLSDLW